MIVIARSPEMISGLHFSLPVYKVDPPGNVRPWSYDIPNVKSPRILVVFAEEICLDRYPLKFSFEHLPATERRPDLQRVAGTIRCRVKAKPGRADLAGRGCLVRRKIHGREFVKCPDYRLPVLVIREENAGESALIWRCSVRIDSDVKRSIISRR